MISKRTNLVVAVIAAALFCTFIIGLAHSISTGFAGFWGGLPFWIIAVAVLARAIYDVWAETLGKRD
jgi:hypothetical protein